MNILILTGKFGMGHYSAALSLSQQIKEANPSADILVEDIFDYSMPDYSDKVYKAFNLMVKRGSRFYNQFYKITENKTTDLKPIFLNYFLEKIENLVNSENPDVIFCTLPLCAQIVSRYKEKTGNTIVLITCITDISSHSEWINEHTDLYFAPSKSVKYKLIDKGVEESKIYVFGIPVKSEFNLNKLPKTDLQKRILIMGGGLGLLPVSENFYKGLSQTKEVSITVITGKNEEIYNRLYGKYDNIEVIGYTDEVYRYMQEADVVISKPGGITLFETIHSETPLLVFEPFLQQEINNTGFIVNNGIGMILKKNPKKCLKEIEEIINNESLLIQMNDNVKNLKKEYDQQVMQRILIFIELSRKEVYA